MEAQNAVTNVQRSTDAPSNSLNMLETPCGNEKDSAKQKGTMKLNENAKRGRKVCGLAGSWLKNTSLEAARIDMHDSV